MTERSSPDSAVRPLREDEVIALHDLADNGGLICDCDSSPELCHCSTIMMLCDEWRAMRSSVKSDNAQAAQTIVWKALKTAQKIIEREFPNGQAVIDIREAVASLAPPQAARPVAQPVAWRYQMKEGWDGIWRVVTVEPTFEFPKNWRVEPLYTAHAQPQEVRNAVIEECAKVADDEQARAAERQKIETEKNGNTIYGLPGVLAALIAARIRELKLNSLSRPLRD